MTAMLNPTLHAPGVLRLTLLLSWAPLILCLAAGCSSSDVCQKASDLCGAGQDFPEACEGAAQELASCVVDRGDCSPATLIECSGMPRADGGLPITEAGLPAGDSGLGSGREICERYLACAAATSPATLPSLLEGYGPDGTCWASGSADLCLQACRRGLSQLRVAAGGEPACRCLESSECLEPGALVCDLLNGACGECSASAECGAQEACHRSPQGTRCRGCGGYYPDNEVCGLAYAISSDLWSTAPACVFQGGTPTCVQCSADMDCGGAICDLTTHTCPQQHPSCLGIWQCLRFAPMECAIGSDCCNQGLCPQAASYITCMATHCSSCDDGASCISCSKTNCQPEYLTCSASCAS